MSEKENTERLLRAIRTLQLLQRTNSPRSSLAKSAGKALVPLLKELAERTNADPLIEAAMDNETPALLQPQAE